MKKRGKNLKGYLHTYSFADYFAGSFEVTLL